MDDDELTEYLTLAQQLIKKEAEPTPETCSKLMVFRIQLDDQELSNVGDEIKDLFDQAIGTCKNSMYQPPPEEKRKRLKPFKPYRKYGRR